MFLRKLFQTLFNPGISRGDPSVNGSFPVSAKVKTSPVKPAISPENDPDNLGEHAIGLGNPSGKPNIKYVKGPRKTAADVEDVFDDCGEDFTSVQLDDSEGPIIQHLEDPPEKDSSSKVFQTLSFFMSTYPFSKHHVCELYGGEGNVVK